MNRIACEKERKAPQPCLSDTSSETNTASEMVADLVVEVLPEPPGEDSAKSKHKRKLVVRMATRSSDGKPCIATPESVAVPHISSDESYYYSDSEGYMNFKAPKVAFVVEYAWGRKGSTSS